MPFNLKQCHYLVTLADCNSFHQAARTLFITQPTLSIAMKKLRENGYISMDDGLITLLPEGEAIARRIYERHQVLTRFFVKLGVPAEQAAVDACKVEHDLSEETFAKLKEHAFRKD